MTAMELVTREKKRAEQAYIFALRRIGASETEVKHHEELVKLWEQVERKVSSDGTMQGHWVDKATGRYGQRQSWCSVCGKPSGIGGIESNRHKPYCPNCGAKMIKDGES